MTVTNTTLPRADYTGNGTTTIFTVPFRILDETHISVTLVTGPSEAAQVLNTDYTVQNVGDPTAQITMTVAPTTSQTLIILRDVPLTQLLDYVTSDKFPAESHEDGLDKLTMIIQQQQEEISRLDSVDLSGNPITASVASLTSLKALNAGAYTIVFLRGRTTVGDGAEGYFLWRTGDQSTNVTNDPQSGVWVPPDSDATGTTGAWQRIVAAGEVTPEMFGAAGDSDGTTGNGTDDTTALQAWLDHLHATGGGLIGVLLNKIYRVTSSIDKIDGGVSLTIRGAGAGQTFLFGDYVGPGGGILDLSDTNGGGYTTKAHRISGIGFLGRNTAGDPIGLKMGNAWEAVVDDIDAPYRGAGALANSAVWVTNDNNSKWTNIRSQSGYQPLVYSTSTARVTITVSSTTINATTGTPFEAGQVGETIYFAKGSDTGTHAIWKTTIASFVTSTQITVNDPAPSSDTDVWITIGSLTGSITTGTNSLTTNVALDTNLIGSQIHIFRAMDVTNAANVNGLLSTTISNISGTTVTLADNAGKTVTDETVLIAPALFVGSLEGDRVINRQVNHSWWVDVHTEGFQAAGIIVNRGIHLHFTNAKVHGPAYSVAPDWGQALHALVISEAKKVTFTNMQSAYTIGGSPVMIMGSRGAVSLRDFEANHVAKDEPYIKCIDNTDDFRLMVDGFWMTNSVSAFTSGYHPVEIENFWQLEMGVVTPRTLKLNSVTWNSPVVSPGATMISRRVSIADDGVFTFSVPGNQGLLHVASGAANISAIVHYRTSDNSGGRLCTGLALDTFIDVTAVSDLSGTTGTDGRVTIGPDSSGGMRVENRRGFAVFFNFFITCYGDG